ncbi:MAG TPA: hypothetical protein VLE49_15315 [Anaerolineales bacterium]|nr:hypothetical protein [Anaerolineales bacterium]
MDNPLTPENQNILIEDALQTYPMAAMPRDITADVMRRIQTIPAPRPFRLTWNDFVLGIILALCVGAVWFSLDHLPPLAVAQIRKESILFYQHILVNARWLIPAFSFGLAAVLSALTIPYLRQELTKESA